MVLKAVAEDDLTPKQATPEQTEEDFLAEARNRFTAALNYDQQDRQDAMKDVEFIAGDQWDNRSRQIRETLKRPILTWNRLPKFIDQVSNDGRQNKPAIHTTPADGTPKATSDVYQGRIRQIEYESDADIAYDSSREQQIGCGRGFYRITTEWCKPPKWKQKIKFEPIENQFSVTYDPAAKRYDRDDAEYVFIETLMSKGQYRRKFGSKTRASQNDFFAGSTSTDNPAPDWFNVGENGDNVRVAEYWVKEWYEYTLCQLADGKSCRLEDCPEKALVINRRTELDCKIIQYIIDGVQILKETEWIGSCFPIVPVWGRQEVVKGKRKNISLIRHAHDAQRLVNLYVSNIAEQIAMMPKAPYIGFEGQFDGHEEEWEEVNNIPRAYLQVTPVFQNGTLLPPPQRIQSEPPIQALSVGLGQALDALKAACGIYDASLGAAPPDASGLAIQRRNTESDLGNFHFSDNEARSRKYAGRIVIELIKKLEADEDSVTIRHVDGKTSHVKLNQPTRHTDGSSVTHSLGDAEIEPHIFTGPSYTSARQEAFAVYSQIAQSDKNFMTIAGDKLFRAMDAPGADEIADRYERMLPPQLQQPGDPSALNAKLQQSMQMIQQLSQTVHALQDKLDSKQLENETRLKIAQMQEETKRQNIQVQATIAEANLGAKMAVAQLQAQIDAIQHSIETSQAGQQMANDHSANEFDALMDHYSAINPPEPEEPSDNSGQ